uniref:Probable molybdopterin-synthase adenylyltransferase n=1 Tax=Scinaia undulata TaxID=1884664 RepID=A0A1G4NXY8_9FLOR|nr:Molybdopterin biosynthesis protein [Scinaia undulata]SCW23474.1 Molybdopterin biosynthesis protein [Scinaia undulata]
MAHNHSTTLKNIEYQLYGRQIILSEIQDEGQIRLKNARILFIGAGGLASSGLLYLAASGIGHIGIVDNDQVELSNLQRQIIYERNNVGMPKVSSAKTRIKGINCQCKINTYNTKLNNSNAIDIIKQYNIVIDSTDNLNARYAISSACELLHKIHIYGAISSFTGQVSVFNYRGSLSYKDVYPALSSNTNINCSFNGVLGVLPGLIGLIQATEAIKITLGIGKILNGQLLVYNALKMSFHKTKFRQAKNNNTCQYLPKAIDNLDNNRYKFITVQEIQEINHQKLYLIDIRTSTEYKIDHLKSAINIPLDKLRKYKNLDTLLIRSTNKLVILYCNSYSRSHAASNILSTKKIQHKVLSLNA